MAEMTKTLAPPQERSASRAPERQVSQQQATGSNRRPRLGGDPQRLLQLQQAAGNQTVGRLLSRQALGSDATPRPGTQAVERPVPPSPRFLLEPSFETGPGDVLLDAETQATAAAEERVADEPAGSAAGDQDLQSVPKAPAAAGEAALEDDTRAHASQTGKQARQSAARDADERAQSEESLGEERRDAATEEAEGTDERAEGEAEATEEQDSETHSGEGSQRREAGDRVAGEGAELDEGAPGEGETSEEGFALPPLVVPVMPRRPLGAIPRFRPPKLAPPARLDAQTLSAIADRTGLSAQEHRRRLERDLGELIKETGQRHAQLASHVDRLTNNARVVFRDEQAARHVLFQDLSVVTASTYADARSLVDSVADDALARIEQQAVASRRRIWGITARLQRAVITNHGRAADDVRDLKAEAQSPFTQLLSEAQGSVSETASTAATQLAEKGQEIAGSFAMSGADAIETARNESKSRAAPELARRAATDVETGGVQMSESIMAEDEAFSRIIDNLLVPVSRHVTNIGEHGEGAVRTAGRRAVRRLARQKRESIAQVEQMRTRVLGQLVQEEARALAELDRSTQQLEMDIGVAHGSVDVELSSSVVTMLENYQSEIDRLTQSLGGKQGFVDHFEAQDALSSASAVLQRMYEEYRAGLDEVAAQTIARLRDGFSQRYEQARGLGRQHQQEALLAGDRQTAMLSEAVDRFGQGIEAVEKSVAASVQTYVAPVRQTLAGYLAQVNKELGTLYEGTRTQLDTRLNTYGEERRNQVTELPQALSSRLEERADETEQDLSRRADSAFDAMRGAGTNEGPLMDALRNITAIQGNAIRQIWTDHIDASETLDEWLDSELSGSEYRAATAYLSGNTAAGARWELDASMTWYGDDEERIERVLRSLSREDREAMMQLPEWEDTESDLRDSLSGTDLNVTDALLAGNRHRADAYRLRDRINEARYRGNHDQVHTLLAGIPPGDLARVQQEFSHIEGHVDLDQGEQIDQDRAATIFADYVTRPIETYQQGPGYGGAQPGGAQPRTLRMTGANRDLAYELAYRGSASMEARAARLAVETERRGGPNLENLETALNDPRLQSEDPQVVAQAQQERQAMLQIFATRYGGGEQAESAEGAQAFAEQRLRQAYRGEERGQELAVSMLREGRPDPVIALAFAVEGAGTNEALIQRTLQGMTREQIQQMRAQYRERVGRDLYSDLGVFGQGGFFTELSGDERHKVEVALMGVPQNDRERMEIAQMRRDYQRNETGFLGRGLMSDSIEDRALERNYTEMQRMVQELGPDAFDEQGNFRGDRARFARYVRHTNYAAENYGAQVDRMANYATTAIAIAGAAVAAVVSGGAATPLLAMAIAGGTGLASMGANYALRGGRYGWEQAAADLGMTAAQTVTAGAGAKLGALSRAGRLTGGPLRDAALIGAGTGFVNTAAQTALTDATWDRGLGEGLERLVSQGLRGSLAGAATGVASGAFERTGVGRRLTESSSLWTRGTGKALSSGLGGSAGRSVELLYDRATGRYRGDIDDALFSVLEAGGQNALQGFFEGAGEAIHRRVVPNFDDLNINLTEDDILDDLGVSRSARDAEQAEQRITPLPEAEEVARPTQRPTETTEPEPGRPPPTEVEERRAAPRSTDDTDRLSDELVLMRMSDMETDGQIRPDQIDHVLDGSTAAERAARLAEILDAQNARPLAAEAIPGTGFHGGRTTRNRVGIERATDEALRSLADMPGVQLAGRQITYETPSGRQITVDVQVGPTPGSTRALTRKSAAVATIDVVDEANNRFAVTVSDRAGTAHVGRALAHELAEIRHRVEHGQGVDVLRPGTLRPPAQTGTQTKPVDAPAARPSAHDVGRLAEVEYLAGQISQAQKAGNRRRVTDLRKEAEALVRHMGLVEGDRSADRRQVIVDFAGGEDTPLVRAVDDFVGTAQTRQVDLLKDLENLKYMDAEVMEQVRQRYADMDNFQDWNDFLGQYRERNPTGRRDYDEKLFRAWASGKYINPETGQPIGLLERRVDPRFRARAQAMELEDRVRLDPTETIVGDQEITVQDLLRRRRLAIEAREDIDRQLSRTDLINTERDALVDQRNKLIHKINQPTSKVGDQAARRVAETSLEVRAQDEIDLPHKASGVPDLLYRTPDGRVVVVEAKGGESPLGMRRGGPGVYVEQGTRAYLESLIGAMKSSPSAEIKRAGELMEVALANNQLDYFLVRQYINEDGTLGAIEAAQFDITRRD